MPLRARFRGRVTARRRQCTGSSALDWAPAAVTVTRLFPGELHSPADHLGGMQPDDRPDRFAVRPGRIGEGLRPAADQHAPGPPRRQHVIDHQGDVRVALRVAELPGPGEIPAEAGVAGAAAAGRRHE